MSITLANERYNLAYNYVTALLIEEESEYFYNVKDIQIVQRESFPHPQFMNVSFMMLSLLDSSNCIRTREEFDTYHYDGDEIEINVYLHWKYDDSTDQFHICNTGVPEISLYSVCGADSDYLDSRSECVNETITNFFKKFIVKRHTEYANRYGMNIYRQSFRQCNPHSKIVKHSIPIIHVNDDGKVYYIEKSEKDIMQQIKDFVTYHMGGVFSEERDPVVLLDNNDYYVVNVPINIDVFETDDTFFVLHNPDEDEVIEEYVWFGVLTIKIDIKKRECCVSTAVFAQRDYNYDYIRKIEEEIEIEFRRLDAEKTYTKLTGRAYPMVTGSLPFPTAPSIVVPSNVCEEIVVDKDGNFFDVKGVPALKPTASVNNFLVF